jgi:hypothetical protein
MFKLLAIYHKPVLRVDRQITYLTSRLQYVKLVTLCSFPLTVMHVTSIALRFDSAVFAESLHDQSTALAAIMRSSA